MSILGDLSTDFFMQHYWQKEPLVVRQAVPGIEGLIDGDELAGLACDRDVESRLVLHDEQRAGWRSEQGPFDEGRFQALSEKNWSLLVQAVDQWVPEVADLLTHFGFLPRWGLDDIMVSYATPGGGVGPHFDYYDVFLLQGEGTRRWQTRPRCDENTALLDHPSLRLLAQFEPTSDDLLEAGDMLYVPGGISHSGTAVSPHCVTFSVGFRAPSHADLLQDALALLAQAQGAGQLFKEHRPTLDSDPFCISQRTLDELDKVWDRIDRADIRSALATAFGSQVTEPRHAELIEAEGSLDMESLRGRIEHSETLTLEHNAFSRFAYRLTALEAELFVDGQTYRTTETLARGICHGRVDSSALSEARERGLLLELINQGSVSLRSES